MNKFYIIATPIGNLNEISNRALEAFEMTTTFLSEDTRVTKKLLNNLGIEIGDKSFVKLNSFNDNLEASKISKILEKGNCALVSDAGYPMISDPGYGIWKSLDELQILPEIINGSSAILHALILSGFALNNFYFQGFLSNNKSTMDEQLKAISQIKATIVIYEGVNKLIKTLDRIEQFFGNIEICVVKELTKLNEKRYKGKILDIKNQIDLRGEFVILFENNPNLALQEKQIEFEIKKLIKNGTHNKDACKLVGYKYNLKPNELFRKFGTK